MERSGLEKYGLRVVADYRSVEFLPGTAKWLDEETLELSGRIDFHVERAGKLRIITAGRTSASLTIDALGDLVIEHVGRIDETVKMDRLVRLGEGVSVTDVTAVHVTGQFDVLTKALHAARSSSRILSKIVVDGAGKAIARGTIVIGKEAGGSDGFERIDALLLSKEAKADVLPTLEVATDDVHCKHAASVGSIDDEQVFYLTSRGLSETEAKQVFAEGFLHEVCVYGRP